MPIKKITFVIYSLASGGAERVAANLANYWAAKGWQITIITLCDAYQDFYELDLKIQRISLGLAKDSTNPLKGLWMNIRRVFALRKVLINNQPDIVVGMMTTANILISLATIGIPAIRRIGSEHIHPPQMPLSSVWEKIRCYCYYRLNALTALTQESADWLKQHTLAKNLIIIPNPVIYPLPEKPPTLHPDSICLANRKILLAVGRLHKQKGFDVLLEAYANLFDRYPDWDLVILGEGDERISLEDQSKTLNISSRVFLPGLVGNIGSWYNRAELYVMSSRFEGFPNTLTEAMAHGLAAISFNCDTGPRDIIRHEIDGLLVPPNDIPALTLALENLMGNATLRQSYALRACEARERFSIQRINSLWETVFDEL